MQDLIESPRVASIDLAALRPICREAHFAPGEVLRRKGQHYNDMYLISAGSVDVDLETSRGTKVVVSGAGSPIGEIGFLHGRAAMATVTARTPVSALTIDDPALIHLEREQPVAAALLLRHLTNAAEERISFNLTWQFLDAAVRSNAIDVYLCRSPDMLERAQRLRYEVYCQELGRQSPYADHERRVITDRLDDDGHVFVALENGETIGTLRGNVSANGSLGLYEELYRMNASQHHPQATAICTKFIVKRSRRGGPAAMKLISAMVRFGLRIDVKECYIDCIPALLPYYKALGFTITGHQFFHRENGPSFPMMLDLTRHGRKLSNEAGMRDYLNLIMKAQAIKLIDGVRGYAALAARR
jgi:CRP-like cAMP-binding protein/predicted GNAT family N-acyltransferase